jgi:putative Mg2+ transporter-C (MgtC) family protein
MPPNPVSLQDFALRLSVAFALGTLIGIERQRRQRLAGARTNALVATGSGMFVLLASLTIPPANTLGMAAQVVTGIGFLGAGVIIRDGLNVRGLNSAATVWCSAGVGVLAGSGFLAPAAIGCVFVLLANLVLRPLAYRFDPTATADEDTTVCYTISAVCNSEAESRIRTRLLSEAQALGLGLRSLQSADSDHGLKIEVSADLFSSGRQDPNVERVVTQLSMDPSVSAVRWEILGQTTETQSTLLEEFAETRGPGPL